MSARDRVVDDDAKARAMAIYKAKGKAATVMAASSMRSHSSASRAAMQKNDSSESELSSESDLSDSEEEERRSRGSRKGSARRGGRRRNRDDSLSDDSVSEGDGRDGPKGFDDDTFGTQGAKLAKLKRHRSKTFLFLDKLCPCCSVANKYAVGDKKTDAAAKIYEGVDNTLEPVLRLLSLFTMGVPSTESSIPFAHLLPLILSTCLCFGGTLLFGSDWSDDYPLNSWSFLVLFFMQFAFLAQGSRYFRARAMSTLCKELEGRSWNWTRQLPLLLKIVNQHSAAFLAILIFGYVLSFIAYFVYSDLDPVGGLLVFYVSRVMFGFYMNGVLFCMPVLFALEAHMVSHRVQAYTEALGKFPNLDSAIEEHIEIWKCIDRLSRLWGPTIAFTAIGTVVCSCCNIHYLLGRHSQYFLVNVLWPGFALFIFLHSASKITSRCQYTAVHLSGYRSSADIFLAPLERIDFLTYLSANDPGFRVMGVLVTAQGVQKMAGLFGTVCVYLYTLQYGFKEEPAVGLPCSLPPSLPPYLS